MHSLCFHCRRTASGSELDAAVVSVDSGSSILEERGALLAVKRGSERPLLAAVLLVSIALTAHTGGLAEVPPEDQPLPEPEESLRIADVDIENQEYNDAVPRLVDAVRADEEQLPAAESRFERIRAARTAYVEKGREVEAE